MISRGDLFTNSAGGSFRLLEVTLERGKKVAHVFGMDENKALPKQWLYDDIVAGEKAGEYTRQKSRGAPVVVSVARDAAPRDGSTEAVTKAPADTLADWRWELIKPLVSNTRIYFRKLRGQLVENRAKEMDASPETIMTSLRLYWRGGMTKDALRGGFAQCGVSKVATSQVARGRVPRNQRYEKFVWKDEAEKKRVAAIARRFFKKRKTNTRRYVYLQVVLTMYSYTDADGKIHPRPLGQRPSRDQVLYLLDKSVSLEEKLRHKLGDDNFENNVQPKTGSARDYANGIGQYYEIDSTIVDIWACAADDPSVIIGKAMLYLIIDTFSRVIVGFHLSLEAPSWDVAKEAMLSLVEDPRDICARWGYPYRPEDWECHGYWPAQFRADRGPEMMSYASDSIAEGLEGSIVNVPRRKAPRKGTVECTFNLYTVCLQDNAGGHTPSADFRKRQTDDYKGEAARTLKSIAHELLDFRRKHNLSVHRRIQLPAANVYKGHQPIPVDMWKRDFEERAGMLTQFDADFLRFKLLPKAEMTVTAVGVFYKGLLWAPDTREGKTKWLLPAEVNGSYQATATHQTSLVDVIYVHDRKDPTKWTTMHLVGVSVQHAGKTFAEVAHYKDALLTLDELAAEHNLRLDIQYMAAAQTREKASQASVRKAIAKNPGKSRTAAGVKFRDAEARKNRQATKKLASTAVSEDATALPSPGSAPAPTSTGTKSASPSRPHSPNPSAAANDDLLDLLTFRN